MLIQYFLSNGSRMRQPTKSHHHREQQAVIHIAGGGDQRPISTGASAPAKLPNLLKMPPAVALTLLLVAFANSAKIFGAPAPIKVLKAMAAITL